MYEVREGLHTVEVTVTIDSSPGEVFGFLTDPDAVPLFWSNMIDYEHDSDPLEKGTRARVTLRIAGRKLRWTAELTELEPERLLVWRTVEAPFDFSYEYRLRPVDDGTAVTYQAQAENLGGVFGRLAEGLVARFLDRDVRGNLTHLKELVEADTRPGGHATGPHPS